MLERLLRSGVHSALLGWRRFAKSVPRHVDVQADIPSTQESELQATIEGLKKGYKDLLESNRRGVTDSGQELARLRKELAAAQEALKSAQDQCEELQEVVEDVCWLK